MRREWDLTAREALLDVVDHWRRECVERAQAGEGIRPRPPRTPEEYEAQEVWTATVYDCTPTS